MPEGLITVTDYYRDAEKYAHTELIHSQVIPMSPIGIRRAILVSEIGNISAVVIDKFYQQQLKVRQRTPVRLNDFSEPQPDFTVVKYRADFYSKNHPQPEDIFLIIEVADATINYGLSVKVPLHASVNIPEVWLQCLVHQQPTEDRYQNVITRNKNAIVSLTRYPKLRVELGQLFGS